MCKLCFPEGKELGMLAEGMSLILNKGKYSILGVQGHTGEELITFDEPPSSDPSEYWDDDLGVSEEEMGAFEEWMGKAEIYAERMSQGFDFRNAYFIVQDLIKAGYAPEEDGIAEFWLIHKAGLLVEKFEATAS